MTILTITGLSGVGKDTCAEYIASKTGWNIIRSYTTRPMREGETNGKEHIFVKSTAETNMLNVLAYTEYGGYEYWTTWEQFEGNDVNIYVVDEKGLADVEKAKLYESFHLYKLRIIAGTSILERRGVSKERIIRDLQTRIPVEVSFDKTMTNNKNLPLLYYKLDKVIDEVKRLYNIA